MFAVALQACGSACKACRCRSVCVLPASKALCEHFAFGDFRLGPACWAVRSSRVSLGFRDCVRLVVSPPSHVCLQVIVLAVLVGLRWVGMGGVGRANGQRAPRTLNHDKQLLVRRCLIEPIAPKLVRKQTETMEIFFCVSCVRRKCGAVTPGRSVHAWPRLSFSGCVKSCLLSVVLSAASGLCR